MAEQDLILRMRVIDGAVSAAEVEGVSRSLGSVERSARRAGEAGVVAGRGFSGLRRIIGSVMGVTGLAGISFGLAELIKNAEGFQNTTAQLRAAIKANITNPSKEMYSSLIDFAERFSSRGGFAPPDEIKGMTLLMRITHSMNKTMSDLTLATNIARGAHLGMAQATRVVAMAEMGRTTGLTRLGIAMPKHVTSAQAMAILLKRYAGATDAYNKTASGAMTNFEHALDIVGEKIGLMLVPYLTKAFTWLAKMIDQATAGKGIFHTLGGILSDVGHTISDVVGFIKRMVEGWKENRTWAVLLVTALAMLTGMAIVAWIANVIRGLKAWVAEQALLNMVMDANPMGILILAIGALVGALIVAYTKIGWFRNAVDAAWSWLKTATSDVVGWFKKHWFTALMIAAPFAGVAVFVAGHFQQIKKVIVAGVNDVIGVIDDLIKAYNSLPFTPNIGLIGKIGVTSKRQGRDMAPASSLGVLRRTRGTITPAGADMAPSGSRGRVSITPRGADMAPSLTPRGADMAPASDYATAIAGALHGAIVTMDGQKVGQLVVRRGNLAKSTQ